MSGQAVQLPEGTVVVEGPLGYAMVWVYYPWRKSPEIYIAVAGKPTHCLDCGTDLEEGQGPFLAHVRSHDRRKGARARGESSEGIVLLALAP